MTKATYLFKMRSLIIFLLPLCYVLLLTNQVQATVRYVTRTNVLPPNQQGDGLSWAQGTDMLKAISNAVAGDEIWVKEGNYPASNVQIGQSFQYWTMKSGVKVYGGFNGTETIQSQRNPTLYPVVIRASSSASNFVLSYVSANNETLLDGVTVQGSTQYAAISVDGGAPVFQNLIIQNCASIGAGNGGGMMMNDASPVLRNITFQNNTAKYGGAVYADNSFPYFSKVIFKGNKVSVDGGAVYTTHSAPSFSNTVFQNNRCTGTGLGGAVNIYYDASNNAKASFRNVVFCNNQAEGGIGGAAYCQISSPLFLNCSFVNNGCGTDESGGAIHTWAPASNALVTSTITNCAFFNNLCNTSDYPKVCDVDTFRNGRSTVTFSYFKETNIFNGNGNRTTNGNPFTDTTKPAGTNGIWMDCDDGLIPLLADVIDKGNNGVLDTLTKDIAGQSRRYNVTSVTDGGSGTAPIVDMGAYESQMPDDAQIALLAGSIGNGHTVPTPQELFTDAITSVSNPAPGLSIRWQQNSSNGTTGWDSATILSPADSVGYRLPNLIHSTYYRRVARSAGCNAEYASNVIQIKVVAPDGAISGEIKSQNGVAVKGITVQIQRITARSGSPAGYIYTSVTDYNGRFQVNPIYYGDKSISGISDSFMVKPVKTGHTFDPVETKLYLSESVPQVSGKDFKDLTVLTIVGRTFQQCTDCYNNITGTTENKTCPIDSISILRYTGTGFTTLSDSTKTVFMDTAWGRYALTMTDPVATRIKPNFAGHSFIPVYRDTTPVDNLKGIDFQDATMHTITGRLVAGCNSYIGQALLEFTDTLPSQNGTPRVSCFRKRVMTNAGSGTFSITLPARVYRIEVKEFYPALLPSDPAYVNQSTVLNFFSAKISKDSLVRNITKSDTTLNLVYVRPPSIDITGLNIICSTPTPFARMQRSAYDSFIIRTYQGPVSMGCPLVNDTSQLQVSTNIHLYDVPEVKRLAINDTGANATLGAKVKLMGGIPNITGDHLKDLDIYFTDTYGRNTDFHRKVLVTGVVPPDSAKLFITTSPQVPMVILHDPPGDASSSTWQQSQSISNAIRFYSADAFGAGGWVEAKVGSSQLVGVGVATEVSVWGTLNGSASVTATNTAANEAILTTTHTQSFSTSDNPAVTGSDGDVYIGAALNLKYGIATVIGFNSCTVTSTKQLLIDNKGFSTQYVYSEGFILNTMIPTLQTLAQISPGSADVYLNQASVWQKAVDNNNENKRRAAYVTNWSINGGGQAKTDLVTTTSTKSSSIEFVQEINAGVAAELGFDIGGSGASAGFNINFRMETGKSLTNTATTETTIGYTLKDNTPGDYFSVDVLKDPVYNTPVFRVAAGASSCPTEPGTNPRDAVYAVATNPIVQGVHPDSSASFFIKITNTSPTTQVNPNDKRIYKLNYASSSNVANEIITISGGSSYTSVPLAYNETATIPVAIRRYPGSSIFSYEGEKFIVSSDCGDDLGKTVSLSAYFTSPCNSNVSLGLPQDGWRLNGNDNNRIFIQPTGTTSGSVTLQYIAPGNSSWSDLGSALTTAQLANGFYFDVTTFPDGECKFRLRIDCSSGTVYSDRVTGIIDRRAPQVFSRRPANNSYVDGDEISIAYNEKLSPNANLQITMRRKSGTSISYIPATVSLYENKVNIVPGSSIAGYTGDSIMVVLSGAVDLYGNQKANADTVRFVIGNTVAGTGNQALIVQVTNPVLYKNATDTFIGFEFKLPVNAARDTRVNYSVGGTARYGIDYTASYTNPEATYAGFNGSSGTIKISENSNMAVLRIKPIGGDTSFSLNKTIIISLLEGGDYTLGATTSATGTLTSEDGISTYTFTGDGAWNNPNNWQNSKMPLTTLGAGKQIIINPIGTCILNVPQTIRPGATLTIKQNRRFIIGGNLKINN